MEIYVNVTFLGELKSVFVVDGRAPVLMRSTLNTRAILKTNGRIYVPADHSLKDFYILPQDLIKVEVS